MIAQRTAWVADLVQYLAATALMTVAVAHVHGWLWTAAVIVTYFVLCGAQAIVYGGLRVYLLAAEAADQ